MPRDKKNIHRATSDVEDEEVSDDDQLFANNTSNQPQENDNIKYTENNLIEERKKYLKDAILKRITALKQQRERNRYHRVNSTQ
jgi:hypothetical protein